MFRFPWTNEHELNLDWLIRTVKRIDKKTSGVVTSVNGSTGDVIIPIPSPATINPKPLGPYPAIGTDPGYARADHVHPLPTLVDSVYWAEYGTTTSAEIEAAYQDNKVILCDYSNKIYLMGARFSGTQHIFYTTQNNHIYSLRCFSDVWSIVDTQLEEAGMCIPLTSNTPTTGDFLVWDGGAWVAMSLSVWQGGNY